MSFSESLWQGSPVDRPGEWSWLEQLLFRNFNPTFLISTFQFLVEENVAISEISDNGIPVFHMLSHHNRSNRNQHPSENKHGNKQNQREPWSLRGPKKYHNVRHCAAEPASQHPDHHNQIYIDCAMLDAVASNWSAAYRLPRDLAVPGQAQGQGQARGQANLPADLPQGQAMRSRQAEQAQPDR